MEHFEIIGGKKLNGEIEVNGAKNSAVAVLAGSIINKGKTTLKNMPRIEEVNRWIEILESMGAKIDRHEKTLVIIPPKKIRINSLNEKAAKRTRSVVLLLGALAGKLKNYSIPQAGGCELGSRTVRPHLFVLEKFGVKIKTKEGSYEVNTRKFRSAKKVVLYESGDTVTETALMAAAQIPKETIIKMASANYMVQDLCFFLQKLGVEIMGIGSTTLKIKGKKDIKKDITYEISEDPIEAMFFISLAITTKSALLIKKCPIEFLELELLKLEKMGQQFSITKEYLSLNGRTILVDIKIRPSELNALEDKIHGLPFPGLNMDNLPFFVPIAMVAKGKTLIHDWVYENRAIYFTELNRLGAKITLLDPHRVYIEGPTKIKSAEMMSPPALRPAAIILVVMLAAKGKSVLRNVYSVNRGYEKLEERLRKLGADIKTVSD